MNLTFGPHFVGPHFAYWFVPAQAVPQMLLWALLIPLIIVLAVVPALVIAWMKTRQALQAYYQRPFKLRWLEAPPAEPGEKTKALDQELQGLHYQPVGDLQPEGEGSSFFRVYIHETLPIYALLVIAYDASGVFSAVPQMESFLPNGGRLSTTISPDYGRLTAGAPTGGTRLVQLRTRGPGTPTALDGQHVGTVQAWTAGKREFLPATPEALTEYLTADHKALREAMERTDWPTFPGFLQAQFGRPLGVLKF